MLLCNIANYLIKRKSERYIIITEMLYKKFTKMTSNSKQNRQKAQNTERRKTGF